MAVIDDFEDGDLSEYLISESSNDGVQIVNNSTTSYEGGYFLEVDVTAVAFSGDSYGIAVSTSGLNTYPSSGDTFEFWMNLEIADNTSYAGAIFGHQTSQENYFAGVESNESISLRKDVNTDFEGSGTALASGTSINTGQYYRFEVEWLGDGTITLTVYDSNGSEVGQITASDTDYTDGGFGWISVAASGTEQDNRAVTRFDYAVNGVGASPPSAPSGLNATLS